MVLHVRLDDTEIHRHIGQFRNIVERSFRLDWPAAQFRNRALHNSADRAPHLEIDARFAARAYEEIGSRGGWMELGLRASPRYSFTTGYTIDDPHNGDLLDGARTNNRAWYVTNRFRLAPPILLGIDYLYWKTNFKGRETGTDNRVNLYLIYNF